jgi:hypothetical protein
MLNKFVISEKTMFIINNVLSMPEKTERLSGLGVKDALV